VNKNISTVILGVRNKSKGESARESILAQTTRKIADIQVWCVDLESYDSVLAFMKRVNQLPRLDGFIANAGIETKHFGIAEGLEKTLTINVISTYLMALEVVPKLTDGVLSIVGSMIHVFGPEKQLRSDDVFTDLSHPTTDMGSRYPLSKLIVHLCFLELAEKVRTGVVVNLVNPGWCATELHRYNGEPLMERFMALIFRWTAEKGSRTLVHAVASSDTHGQYLSECLVKPQSAYMRSAQAVKDREELWRQLMQRLEKIKPGISIGFVD
jgi:retinol dehydrogenase 12